MRRSLSLAVATLVCFAAALGPAPAGAAAATLPPGFSDSVVISDLTNPTVVRFTAGGGVLVGEKSGIIKAYGSLTDATPDVVADLNVNVYNYWDRGLLGLEPAPTYPTDPTLYVLYTYDALPGGTAPEWGTAGVYGDTCPDPPGDTADGCVVMGRLSRLNTLTEVETPLITDWCQQYPSHSVGALELAPGGALYATAGEGASFTFADSGQVGNPCGDPVDEGGSLRSQDLRSAGDPFGLDGTIIRVDPATGAAFPGNPNVGHANANVRRIVAYGFRNPFRFALRPGTAELWLGDVGAGAWEEIDRLIAPVTAPVENFGWPCYEGALNNPSFDGLSLCDTLAPGAVTAPVFAYNHSASVVPGDGCPTGSSSVSGLAFYGTGGYPAAYEGALFFADYSRKCIWAMLPGAGGTPTPSRIQPFVVAAAGPVDLQIGPNGDLFYVDFDEGEVHRVQYRGPVAALSASPESGAAPLEVSFDASASSDPDGADTLSYEWDLDGDGAFDDGADAAEVEWTYTEPGSYEPRVRVTDHTGAWEVATAHVDVDNAPPVPSIGAPASGTTWSAGETITFSGSAQDPQDGALPAAALSWRLILHHCPSTCHQHALETFPGVAGGTFTAPHDHELPSHLELRLTATDSHGRSATLSRIIHPKTARLRLETNVPGLRLRYDGAGFPAPVKRTVIAGSRHMLEAPSLQFFRGLTYAFDSWSDGGPRAHDVSPTSSTVYRARFVALPADLGVSTRWSQRGDLLTFVVRVRNTGPATALETRIWDSLPGRVRYLGSSLDSCRYRARLHNVRCLIGTIRRGKTRVVRIRTQLLGNPPWVRNLVEADAPSPDLHPQNDRSRVRIVFD